MQYGISFDFWNTLYANGDEEKRHRLRIQYFHTLLSEYRQISNELVQKAFQASTHMFMDEWINKQRTPRPGERILYMCEVIGISLPDDIIKKFADYFGRIIDTVPPLRIPYIDAIVPQLADNFPLAIISDTGYIDGKYIRSFLEKEKILSYFQSNIFSDEQEHCKPHASVFQMTCQNLKVNCNRLIHIGDLEHTDVRGIKDIGGISIKFTGCNDTSITDTQADYVVNNYTELLPLINKITGTNL